MMAARNLGTPNKTQTAPARLVVPLVHTPLILAGTLPRLQMKTLIRMHMCAMALVVFVGVVGARTRVPVHVGVRTAWEVLYL
jgi:hypothetical protein